MPGIRHYHFPISGGPSDLKANRTLNLHFLIVLLRIRNGSCHDCDTAIGNILCTPAHVRVLVPLGSMTTRGLSTLSTLIRDLVTLYQDARYDNGHSQ